MRMQRKTRRRLKESRERFDTEQGLIGHEADEDWAKKSASIEELQALAQLYKGPEDHTLRYYFFGWRHLSLSDSYVTGFVAAALQVLNSIDAAEATA